MNTISHTNNTKASINSSDVIAAGSSLPVVLSSDQLRQFGLTESDIPEITTLAAQLDVANPMSIAEFGRAVSEQSAGFADQLLAQVKSTDLDAAGAKLNEVVLAAKQLNLHALSDKRSRIPIIGKYIDRLKLSKERVVAQFNSTKEQIDTLLGEVEHSRTGLASRVEGLESMFASVQETYRLFGLHIAAAKLKQQELTAQCANLRQLQQTPVIALQIADLESQASSLDKRIGDFTVLQQSVMQFLPMIRMTQRNNRAVVEKLDTVKELAIPSWKHQFLLALSLNEQRNAIALANHIDDTTNDLLQKNAELLRQNSVAAAKANQRLVIDVSTLENVQKTLISTVEEVIRIQQEGVRSRQQDAVRIGQMRLELESRLTKRIEAPRAA